MSHHSLVLAGWALIALGIILYLGVAATAMLRVSRQYSRAMSGGAGLRLAAVLAAAAKRWYLLILVVAGIILLLAGR